MSNTAQRSTTPSAARQLTVHPGQQTLSQKQEKKDPEMVMVITALTSSSQCQVFCNYPARGGIHPPYPKCGLHVQTEDVTCMLTRLQKGLLLAQEGFLGRGRAGSQGSLKMAWLKGRVSGFGFMVVQGLAHSEVYTIVAVTGMVETALPAP